MHAVPRVQVQVAVPRYQHQPHLRSNAIITMPAFLPSQPMNLRRHTKTGRTAINRNQIRRSSQRNRPRHFTTPVQMSAPSAIPTPIPSATRGILMVCLGNICRSPAAECILSSYISAASLSPPFFVESCGTGGGSESWYLPDGHVFHMGDPPDSRMAQAASERDIKVEGSSRPLVPADFERFELILGMDDANVREIERVRQYWGATGDATVAKFGRFFEQDSGANVPDPYWGGEKGFDVALDMIEDGCKGVVQWANEQLQKELQEQQQPQQSE